RVGAAWNVRGHGKTAVRVGVGRFFLRDALGTSGALVNNPPFSITRVGIRALDSAAEPCEGCLTPAAGFPGYGRDPRSRVPSNWQWNATLEQEVWRNAILELSYVGSRGLNMGRTVDVNAIPSADRNGNGVSDRLDYARVGVGGSAAAAALRPFGVFGDVQITQAQTSGRSIYHGLETQLRGRFGHGSQFQASYTFAKTIADNFLNGTFATTISDPERPDLDRGLPGYSRKHVFNASAILDLPAFKGGSAFAQGVLCGWQISTIVAAASGSPITVYPYGSPPSDLNGLSGTGSWGTERPNRVLGEPCRATGGNKQQWLNPAAFTLAGFELGHFGDSGTGVCE